MTKVNDWRSRLTPSEQMVLKEIELDLGHHRFKSKVLSQERRAIYLRAAQRIHRDKQKGVDGPLEKV